MLTSKNPIDFKLSNAMEKKIKNRIFNWSTLEYDDVQRLELKVAERTKLKSHCGRKMTMIKAFQIADSEGVSHPNERRLYFIIHVCAQPLCLSIDFPIFSRVCQRNKSGGSALDSY